MFRRIDRIGDGIVRRKGKLYQIVRKKSRHIEHSGRLIISVSFLRNIKRACQPSIEKYDTCLAKNKSNPLSCIDLLREVCRPLIISMLILVDFVCGYSSETGGHCHSPTTNFTMNDPGWNIHKLKKVNFESRSSQELYIQIVSRPF